MRLVITLKILLVLVWMIISLLLMIIALWHKSYLWWDRRRSNHLFRLLSTAKAYTSNSKAICFIIKGVPREESHKPADTVQLWFYFVIFQVSGQSRIMILDHDSDHFKYDFETVEILILILTTYINLEIPCRNRNLSSIDRKTIWTLHSICLDLLPLSWDK